MKNDLISRAALLDTLGSISPRDRNYRRALEIVESAAAVDAAPVVHGRWIKISEAPEWDQRRCSICSDIACCQGNYCMNCGAKMDGGDD